MRLTAASGAGSAHGIEAHLEASIKADCLEDPLYCVDLGKVVSLYTDWVAALPRVKPFYAVKCFPDKAIIATLAALGAGFDCASDTEVSTSLLTIDLTSQSYS